MNKEVSAKIVELMLKIGSDLNASVHLVQRECSDEDFSRYRAVVGKLMGTMLLDAMNPIFDEYPDLKPERLR